jgi:hypothetical protein
MNTENNKLLAEFMGVFDKILSTQNIHSWSDAPFYYTTENSKEKVIENISNYVKYDTDWNWLMEVVEKIESIGSSEVMDRKIYSRFQIYGNHIQLDWRRDNQDLLRLEVWQKQMLTHKGYSCKEYKRIDIEKNTTRMEALYIACVEFVKWYNEQSK